ncbi:hypothetical protein HYH03_016089 [Edaphochlamys debaryana]|uniref:Uncharacterized protein n=1 Tax=Edaphochlamys debaryana TaxID=47281 RepID=A0A836BQJ3_9CHLO|nr:hypothetical protein HYH03_016089 [Edaphochlamys debaryana]|eukprot:KAG2485200.1 hypothetical protein HYH03_016089 [Edaphochlamys debaryana]
MRRVKDYVYVASQKASNCQPVDPVVVPVVRHVARRVAGATPAAKRPRAGARGTWEAADPPGTAAGPAPPRTWGADMRTWAERQQRTEAAWAQQLPAMRQELLKLAKQHDTQQGQRAGDLLAQAGLSAANYVEYLGKLSGTKLDDWQFVGSFFGYLRASHGLTCLSNLLEAVDFTDPFVHCPICAKTADMRTPEQFAYYLLMLQELIQLRPDLSDVYIDFGCRLMSTWERFVNNHPDLPPEAKQLRIMVKWMHASGQDSACQLQNSGRYKLGAGAHVGEQTEQLWSQAAKPIGGLVRYMTHHHRRDVLEAQLDAVSKDKLDGIVSRLSSRFKDTTRQLRELRAAEEAAIAAAREAAVDDVDVAGAEYIMSVVAPTSSVEAAQDWEAEYVQLLLRKSWLGQLQSGAALLAVVSSSAAVDLAAASTADRLEKLEKAVRALEAKHGVQASVWSRGHPPYDTAICRLRDREVQQCRDRVEALVLEMQQLTTEREEAGCMDKEAKRIAARARRKRKVVRRLLEEMYVWQGVDGGIVERLTEEQVKGLYREGAEQPWGAGLSGGGALRLHHGRRYVETASTRARYEEEEEILCVEKQRLAAWLGDIEPRIQLAPKGPAAHCEGTSFILGKRLQQVQRLKAKLACSGIPDIGARREDAAARATVATD